MKHIVITGVSRGIGQKLMELSLERGDKVFGIARQPQELVHENLFLMSGDVNDHDLGNKIMKIYPWKTIDVLINNAGIYLDDSWTNFEKTFVTNSIAPYFLTKSLFPLLKKSSEPKAAFITSMMGSIGDNQSGGSTSYRASKAALNMMVKCLSIDETWLNSLLFHPGWVKTSMGGENAPTEKEESAGGLLALIHASQKSASGTYRDFKGKNLSW